jgi:hypothetical protein
MKNGIAQKKNYGPGGVTESDRRIRILEQNHTQRRINYTSNRYLYTSILCLISRSNDNERSLYIPLICLTFTTTICC